MWQDRLREAAYTSPSGVRTVFTYEDVSREVTKKTTAFDFPGTDGTYVQDLGHTGRQYPLRLFFWGDDYDLEATAFEDALLEQGIGLLEHPIYGTVNVTPFGKIARRDDLKTGANQAIIEVAFWETITTVYPSSQQDPGSEVVQGVEEFNTANAEEFQENVDVSGVVAQETLGSQYEFLLGQVSAALTPIAESQEDVAQQFSAIEQSIDQSIDTLISDPLTLAFQTSLLIQAPARASADISARLSAYGDLANALINGQGAAVTNNNTFQLNDIFAMSYVTGSIVSVVNTEFETKTAALEAAETILTQFDEVVTWRDNQNAALESVDTGGAYQQLQETVALAAGFLVFISFTLRQERTIILDRARTIVDLVAELYGRVDSELDFFINSNQLSGSEILEIPRGRQIVYYV